MPAVALEHSSGILLDVQVIEFEGRTEVSLLGLSACGEGQPLVEQVVLRRPNGQEAPDSPSETQPCRSQARVHSCGPTGVDPVS